MTSQFSPNFCCRLKFQFQVTAVAPGECDPECPPVQETVGAPAAVQSIVEQRLVLPATEGVTLQLGLQRSQVSIVIGDPHSWLVYNGKSY